MGFAIRDARCEILLTTHYSGDLDMELTQEQLDFFAAEGYLKYGPILEQAELETLRCEYDRELRRAAEGEQFRNLSAASNASREEQESAPQQVIQIINMCDRNIEYRKLLYNERILDVVQQLMSPAIMLFHDQALYKPPHTGGAVSWHQDNSYWHCRPANLVSCWLTLDDVDRENGAMQVIPGSHLRPVWHEKEENVVLQEIKTGFDPADAMVVDLPAGGCMFHHCQTLHYTQPNETNRQRRALAIHFMAPGTVDGNGNIIKNNFSHPLLRVALN